MKKIWSVIALLAAFTLLFTACGKSEAVKNTEEFIGAIDKKITLESGDVIAAAREAYDALSDAEKEKVGNFSKLEKAEEEYNGIITFNSDIAAIINAAEASRTKEEEFDLAALIAKYDELTEEYDKMSKSRREMVVDFDKLEASVKVLKGYDENALKAAAAYLKAFNELNAGKGSTVTAIYCLTQIRDDQQYHFFALTYKDKAGKEHEAYANARYATEEAYPTILAHPDLFFAEKAISENFNPIEHGNTKIVLEDAVKAASELKIEAPATTAAVTTTAAATTAAGQTTTAAATTAEAATAAATETAATEAATTAAATTIAAQ